MQMPSRAGQITALVGLVAATAAGLGVGYAATADRAQVVSTAPAAHAVPDTGTATPTSAATTPSASRPVGVATTSPKAAPKASTLAARRNTVADTAADQNQPATDPDGPAAAPVDHGVTRVARPTPSGPGYDDFASCVRFKSPEVCARDFYDSAPPQWQKWVDEQNQPSPSADPS